ncbi:MAG: prepilin-type N-terminal cleavage/methylation domain-containing protein [Elusimicrobiota bacterium]|jgi:prepilin-type N-terminal cleavage/methylation domain-containing protein|nr:prepilin-type N-terminal cleavage/methylation domain-containing protein [Elusimicrobiota bacterium]
MKKKKGFTLIELLVVVLIIGILGTIALPQYNAAVLKSRLSTVMSNVAAISNSLDIYYLTNGSYPVDTVIPLDISIGRCSASGGSINCPTATYDYYVSPIIVIGGFLTGKRGIAYLQYPAYYDNAKRNTRECWADKTNDIANKICKSLGGVENGTSTWRPQDTKSGSWITYRIP